MSLAQTCSQTKRMQTLIERLLGDTDTHCRWINTLSMMENIGARKIVNSESPMQVTETVLKHAAEETRHAYALKRQLNKLKPGACPSYAPADLLNARCSYQYLDRLDVDLSRQLGATLQLSGRELKNHAYVLVTYAIEVRAEMVYTTYQAILKKHQSPVSVRGILAEEDQHLAEMERLIDSLFDQSIDWRARARAVEAPLFDVWIAGVEQQLDAMSDITTPPQVAIGQA